jgi:acetoacetate decarboxylase
MGFVKSYEELERIGQEREVYEPYNVEGVTVMWETKPEIVERLLPPPLKPAGLPIATAFIGRYPKTNLCPQYSEGSLSLWAEFNGEEGLYCLALPGTNDMAMALGRERFGYPKKLANIWFNRAMTYVEGFIERHGVRFFELRGRLSSKFRTEGFQGQVPNEQEFTCYNFKHFLAADGRGFDYNPCLIRVRLIVSTKVAELAEVRVVLRPSEYDPWSEVEIIRMLGAVYVVGNRTTLKGSVEAELDPAAFAPYSLLKWDW